MPWPTPQDYNEAIQNPEQCFADTELRSGTPELTPLGLPRPITGNFASVYRVHCSERDWAVRCFWREFADLQTRYSAISAHLAASRLPYTVGFEYLPRGINVKGQWYPVLKMEWVDGELLDTFVGNHLAESKTLRELAGSWRQMCAALDRAGVAHGDLQHGNVLVSNGSLILVDYDGMYVPALSGRGSHEMGHPHYQHPRRSGSHFGAYLDRFSEWSINTSLLALAGKPDLWRQLNAGDECLLLRKADYDDPEASAAFLALKQHSDPGVRQAVSQLSGFLRIDPSRVQPLNGAASLVGSQTEAPHGRLRSAVALAAAMIAPSVPLEALAVTAPAKAGGAHWLADHVELRDPDLKLSGPHGTVRALLAAVALLVCVSIVTLPALSAPVPAVLLTDLGGLVISLVALVISYRRTELVKRAGDRVVGVRKLQRQRAALLRAVAATESDRSRLAERHSRHLVEFQERREMLNEQHARRRDALEALHEREAKVLAEKLAKYQQNQDGDVKRALQEAQIRHVHGRLRHTRLWSASVPGIGWLTKLRLFALGVWAAADVSAQKIRTIRELGEAQLLSLATWRVEAERLARRSAPKRISEEAAAAIVAGRSRTLKRIEAASRASNDELTLEEERLASRLAERLAEHDRQRARLQEEFDERLGGIDENLDRLHELLPGALSRLRKEYEALSPYRNARFGLYLRSMFLRRPKHPAHGARQDEDAVSPEP
jgi:hypothetical protein